jgi:diacylglycerol kinase family enzyme
LHLPLPPATVEYHRVDAVEIGGDGVPVQVDGDDRGTLPVKVVSVPNALSMVLPDTFQDGEHG